MSGPSNLSPAALKRIMRDIKELDSDSFKQNGIYILYNVYSLCLLRYTP